VKRSVFWPVLLLATAAVVLAVLLPGGRAPEPPRHLPWQIEVLPNGTSRVFGITLGHTTLDEMERILKAEGEVSLFVDGDGRKVVEAYFNDVTLDGLKARMVAVLGFGGARLEALFDRGARIAGLAEGERKVTLSAEDRRLAGRTPVVAVTYLPRIDLDEEILLQRFGAPARRIREPEGGVVHWLYPEKGLDLAVSPEAKEVLQYVPPRDFDRLVVAPLERAAAAFQE